jgi:hypothetical protein
MAAVVTGRMRPARAVVTRRMPATRAVVTTPAGPDGSGDRAGTLDVDGIFIDSFRHAEMFCVARRPGSQLLEMAEGGTLALDWPAGRPAQWRVACGYRSVRARADVSGLQVATWLGAADGRAGGYLR